MRDLIKRTIQDNPALNQKVVAKTVAITESYLSQLLNGVRKGDTKLLVRIAKAAGINKFWSDGLEIYSTDSISGVSSGLGLTGISGAYLEKNQMDTNSGESTENSVSITEHREILQNLREGVISNFSDKEMARQMILDMAEIEKLDRDHYMMLVGEIRGTARALKPKKRAWR